MKRLSILFTILLGVVHSAVAEWIAPPLKTESGYRVPQPDFEPRIPKDHGAHPGYAIEWWYWVGHLESSDGSRKFGFQSTVFRLEGEADTIQPRIGNAPLGSQQLFMAHLSLSDLAAGTYVHTERVFRGGWQAQASTETLDLKVGPIVARWNDGEKSIEKALALPEGRRLQLKFKPSKPLVVFGERNLSRKGNDPAAVSWYWTYPRLEVSGTLIEGDQSTEVSGIAWMDHEIASNALDSQLAGWDWTAIQLEDGTEIKAYRLRTQSGGADPWSTIYWIDPEGATTRVYANDFDWLTDNTWESDHTGNQYPTEVTIRAIHPATGDQMVYRLRPLLDKQEFVGIRPESAYWEGACVVLDGNNQRIGSAYLELVGYGNRIAQKLNN